MWNHVSGIYPELTHVPLVVSGDGLTGQTDRVVSILDLYETVLDLAGVDGPDSDGRVIVPPPTDAETYLAEYRGPFAQSLERAEEYEFDLEQYDRDLFALVESGYYGFEDYDGWREVGTPRRDDPREFLHERVSAHGMDRLARERGDLDERTASRLEELGYI
jgi:arylsulfatase